MRTKTLLCAAALAAGAMTAMAQSNVYSLNVVGYVNLTCGDGLTFVANQLDVDGNGTNNNIAGVFGSVLPVNTKIFKFNTGSGGFDVYIYAKAGRGTGPFTTNWSPNALGSVNPGEGEFVQVPTGSGNQTVTTVGNVLQGPAFANNTGIPGIGGLCALSSIAPIAGAVTTGLNYHAQVNEKIFKFNTGSQGYDVFIYAKAGRGTGPFTTNWSPSEPSLSVGEGFFLQSLAGSTWSNNFIVQ